MNTTTHPLYEVTTDGTEICWGFNSTCTNKGDCDNCSKLNDYNEACMPKEELSANDPFSDYDDTEGFDYDPDYSPLIDKDAYTM